jgi:hypothetical protein
MNSDEHRPRTLPLIVVLGVITAFDATAIDLYLPGFRDIGRSRGANPGNDANISLRVRRGSRHRTTSEEDRNMNNNLPAAAFGHFVLKVDDIDISYQFHAKLACVHLGYFPS